MIINGEKINMKEKIIKFEKSKLKEKKYTVYLKDNNTKEIRKIHFGADGYEQYKDSTGLNCYSKFNHNDVLIAPSWKLLNNLNI